MLRLAMRHFLFFTLQPQDLRAVIQDAVIMEPVKRGKGLLIDGDGQIVVTKLVIREGPVRVMNPKKEVSFYVSTQNA